MDNYEEKYKQALRKALDLYNQGLINPPLEHIFPELTENEDRRIRKGLIEYLKADMEYNPSQNKSFYKKSISWLEKQGQKPKKVSIWKHWKDGIAGNGEGKQIYLIKTGNTYNLSSVLSFECDYIELSELDNLLLEKQGKEVTNINGEDYGIDGLYHAIKILERTVGRVAGYQSDDGILSHEAAIDAVKELYEKQGEKKPTDKSTPKFKIQDAKDGDVLVNGSNIFIFHFLNDTRLMGYCHVNIDNGRFYDDVGKNECFCLIDGIVTPATKEQRDLLFQKMKEAGYEWDADKKELKKIEPKKLNADEVIA